ncbi:MAG: hypothetical protein NTY38_26985, partial [Acidobacteria bacterium]|nr:hypothetical protein [Acidobacteriota bacterium]
DAKRSDYSNIVTRLSGAEGANSVVNGVNLTQMFSRRYAACGLSKIEVPVDSVRGACGATLAVSILRHILRDSEDANVTRNVRDDLASARLDADGIASLYTNEWKDQIRGAVADLFRAREIRKPTDLDTLKADLESLAKRLLGGTGGKPADLTKWLRLRTGGVMEDVRKRTRMLLKDICLENEDRGLMATIRKGGYLELARDQARSLHSPAAEGMPAAFDSLAGGAESQARQLADARDRYIAELDGALTSIPIVLLHAKDVTVRVLGNRIRDYAEQALLVRAEAALMAECKKVAEGLDRELQTWSESLTDALLQHE